MVELAFKFGYSDFRAEVANFYAIFITITNSFLVTLRYLL